MKAWYFSTTDCRLRYDDGRLIEVGAKHTVECKPVLCESGLHGSQDILDALSYAPGPYVWRVKLSGEIVRGDDKAVATEREYLWGYDATDVLRKFARMTWAVASGVSIRDAVWATAWAATRGAAWAAARDARDERDARAARAAVYVRQSRRLYRMIMENRS